LEIEVLKKKWFRLTKEILEELRSLSTRDSPEKKKHFKVNEVMQGFLTSIDLTLCARVTS